MQVFDSNGELVGWMEAWQDDDATGGATCGVKIAEKLPVHDDVFGGAFEVRMELSGAGLFDHPGLNILSAKLHMKDELITRISGQLYQFSFGSYYFLSFSSFCLFVWTPF